MGDRKVYASGTVPTAACRGCGARQKVVSVHGDEVWLVHHLDGNGNECQCRHGDRPLDWGGQGLV